MGVSWGRRWGFPADLGDRLSVEDPTGRTARPHRTPRARARGDNTGYLFVHGAQGRGLSPLDIVCFPSTPPTCELKTLIKLASGLDGRPGAAASRAPNPGASGMPAQPPPEPGGSEEPPPGTGNPSVTNLLEGCWQFSLVFHHLLFLMVVHSLCICSPCFPSSHPVGPVVPSHC